MNTSTTIPFKAISKCVRIHADDVFLLGDLQIPEESHSIVIFSFGNGRCRNNPRSLHTARILRNKGIGTLLCDLITEEEEIEDEVSEKFHNDAHLLAERLIRITQWVENEPVAKGLPIGYFGACTGGAAALIAAAKLPGQVGAVASRGGLMDQAAGFLPLVTCPTLLIVGENDEAGIEQNRNTFAGLTCQKDLKVIAGASHLFGEPGKLEEMAGLSGDWFRQHLGDAVIG